MNNAATLLDLSLQNPFGQHWNSLNKDNVQEQILTGATRHGFTPANLSGMFPQTVPAVLDFGCGIGRNISAIREFFNPVYTVGFDLPNMIDLMPLEVKAKYDKLTTEFEFIESVKPQIVYASLCFQHIPTVLLMRYLERLAAWPHMLYIVTRWYNDGDHNDILDILSSHYWPVWLSKDTEELSWPMSSRNPEMHWSGILMPRNLEQPVISLKSL